MGINPYFQQMYFWRC